MTQKTNSSRSPWIWALGITIVGVVLLLNNFLMLGDINVVNLWPLLLIVFGAQILLRGDILTNRSGRVFGITRGSVESATLDIHAGPVDVHIQGLDAENQDRLIAGQFAPQSRPQLKVDGVHAHLKMDRSHTPWLALTDWEMGIARDLPWQLWVNTHLGEINLDLSELIIHEAVIATGIGDIRVVCPKEAFNTLYLRSTLGSIHLITPSDHHARVTIDGGFALNVNVDESRYHQTDTGDFATLSEIEEVVHSHIHIRGTFGDVYLA